MSARDDGGSAFPVNTGNAGHGGACFPESGMTLRGYLAAKAMQTLISHELANGSYKHICDNSVKSIAGDACFIADAMIAELAK